MTAAGGARRLSVFERYLSLWVALCIAAGVALGTDPWRRLEAWLDEHR